MSAGETNHGNIYIGPAGWSYKDWIGPVYPAGKRIDQLLFIASYFNCIELNSSFYRSPSPDLTAGWARRLSSRPGFKLNVKALQLFTHERKLDRSDMLDFLDRFSPLLSKELIGAFLFQFPWSFKKNPQNMAYLERLGRLIAGHPAAVELRHSSWDSEETWRLLSDGGLSFCNIDQPLIGESMRPSDRVTAPETGYIRLHGRNVKNWFRKDAGRDARYDYLYGVDEMKEWRDRALSMIGKVKNLFIITNNHYQGQALVNAFQIRSMLENRRQEVPVSLAARYPIIGDISEKTGFEFGFPMESEDI